MMQKSFIKFNSSDDFLRNAKGVYYFRELSSVDESCNYYLLILKEEVKDSVLVKLQFDGWKYDVFEGSDEDGEKLINNYAVRFRDTFSSSKPKGNSLTLYPQSKVGDETEYLGYVLDSIPQGKGLREQLTVYRDDAGNVVSKVNG